MSFDAVVANQSWEDQQLNVAHDLAHVDANRSFVAVSADVEPGTLLKENGSGNFLPWNQGTDSADAIVGVYVGPDALDTSSQNAGLVRIFGPVNKDELISWTAANGSTTADPTSAAITALQGEYIFPM